MASNDVDESVLLPEKLSDFQSMFPELNLKQILKKCRNINNESMDQKLIWKYSGGALLAGRPLNSAMILMCGLPGGGKTSTLKALFSDPNLCESRLNDDIVVLQKTLRVPDGTLQSTLKVPMENCRNDMAQNAVHKAADKNPNGGGGLGVEANCFPIGTQILFRNGSSKAIENLHMSDGEDISTFQLKTGLSSSKLSLKASKGETDGTQFCTYLDYKKDIQVEYLVFRFSNGKELRVSEAHLIFEFLGGNGGQIRGKQAKYFKVGEMMVYFSQEESQNGGATGFETPFIQEIGRETLIGAFSPLTTSGTFFADGFLVTSYANIDSFTTAQVSLLPLKMWSQMKNRKTKKLTENLKAAGSDGGKKTKLGHSKTGWKHGIHPYAQCLIGFRKSFAPSIPSLKKNN